jgi:hypothetical protein
MQKNRYIFVPEVPLRVSHFLKIFDIFLTPKICKKICTFLYRRCHSECHIFSKISTFFSRPKYAKKSVSFGFWRTDEQTLRCLMSRRARLTSDHICRPDWVTCRTPNMPRLPSDHMHRPRRVTCLTPNTTCPTSDTTPAQLQAFVQKKECALSGDQRASPLAMVNALCTSYPRPKNTSNRYLRL